MAWDGMLRRLTEVFRRSQVRRDADEELRFHLDLAIADRMKAGLDEPEARRRALAELGRVEVAHEQLAEGRTGFLLEQLGREVVHAARVLRRSPGLSVLSILTMGIGIGLSATVFALVDAVVLAPLPYPDPDRLVRIVDTNQQAGVERAGVASGNVYEWRRRADAFDGIAGHYAMGRTISDGSTADVVIAAQVSQDFFTVAGVAPVIGRPFTVEETERATFNSAAAPTGPDPVVILSHALWQSRFGANPDVIGRAITLERRPFVVVGVMPSGFALPDARVQLWIPWHLSAEHAHDQHYLGGIARLAAGVSIEDGERRLRQVAEDLGREWPETNQGWSVRVLPLRDDMVGSTATVLWVLTGATMLLLIVACANVALLTLMRGLDRAGDTAVRLALGASSPRLVREFLIEAGLLAMLGGVLGAAIALSVLRALPAVMPGLPRLEEVGFDVRVWAFVATATSLAAVLSGLPFAWRSSRLAPAAALSDRSTRTSGGGRRHRVRDAMVMAQVALAVVLLVGSALLVQSVQRLSRVDSGFDPRGVLVAPVFLDNQAYRTGDHTRTYYRTLFERLSAIPGVIAVGGATTAPTSPLGPDFERPVWPEGTLPPAAGRTPAAVRMVTPGYFAAMGLRVVAGRPIDDRDQPDSPRVLMVNETLARRLWPGASAAGRQLVVDYSTTGTYPYDVVGIVADTRFRGPRSEPVPEIYLPHAQRPYLIMNVVVKTAGDPRAQIPAVRAALHEIDPQKPAHALSALEDLLGDTYARDRQAMTTLLVFAVSATLLALLSVYGVLSQRVRDRRREIGIRVVMGADAAGVVGWVTRSGLRLLVPGIVLGMVVARSAAGAAEAMLFGVSAGDLRTSVAVAMAVLSVGVLATLVPAWRATRVDPVAALKNQ